MIICTHPAGPCPFETSLQNGVLHKVPDDCIDEDGQDCEWLEEE